MSEPTGRTLRLLFTLALALLLVGPAHATTWTVCSSGCDHTSIQAAVDAAARGDTIELGAETFFENVNTTLEIVIRGAGPGNTIVDGGGAGIVFDGGNAVLSDMTIQHGDEGVRGPFDLHNCVVRDNTYFGFRVFFGGWPTITSSTITGNGHGLWASGELICSRAGCTLRWTHPSVVDSTISGNDLAGVRLGRYASTDISNSTISGNQWGIFGRGTRSGSIGYSSVTLVDSTIADNIVGIEGTLVEFETRNSIISSSFADNCIGLTDEGDPAPLWIISSERTLSSDNSCPLSHPTDLVNTDPHLLPMADNGGSTATRALAPDSPAIDAGGDDCGPTDQRGTARPVDGDGDGVAKCDIGAFEYLPLAALVGQLIEHVESLDLPRGIENSLLVKLNAASLILGDMQSGNDHAAANMLGAFIRQVEAQYGKTIAASDADALIEGADRIIEMLTEDLTIRRPGFRLRAFSPGRRLGLNPSEPE